MSLLCSFFSPFFFFFFFNDTATTEIYTLSLHDALPISAMRRGRRCPCAAMPTMWRPRSEEHTSELQSRPHLVCRLLLEKKKKPTFLHHDHNHNHRHHTTPHPPHPP